MNRNMDLGINPDKECFWLDIPAGISRDSIYSIYPAGKILVQYSGAYDTYSDGVYGESLPPGLEEVAKKAHRSGAVKIF